MAFREPGAGELNRSVLIRLRTDLPAVDMGLDSIFSDERPRWAKIEPVGTAVYAAGVQTDNKLTHRITLRLLKGVTDAHEVLHGDTIYRVKRSADLNGSHRFTQLEVEELGTIQAGDSIYG